MSPPITLRSAGRAASKRLRGRQIERGKVMKKNASRAEINTAERNLAGAFNDYLLIKYHRLEVLAENAKGKRREKILKAMADLETPMERATQLLKGE